MTVLASAAFIARKDLAYLLRQRETLLWVFLMPVLFFYFIGTVTGGFAGPRGNEPDPLVLRAPAGADLIVDQLVRRLEEQRFRVVRAASDGELEPYARRLTIPAPTTHPAVTDAVLAGQQLVVTFDRHGDPLAASFDRFRVARAVYAVVADLSVLKNDGRTPDAAGFDELAMLPRQLTTSVRPAGRRIEPPLGFAQAVPGTMVMFTMLVLLTSGAIMLVVERRQGLLRRLASAPIAPGAIILGKWVARMALGLVQIVFAMIIGVVLFDMDWGDSLPMVGVVLFSWAGFTASLALLLGNVARTQAQMAGVGVLMTMVLAALGGCWWPIEVAPGWMQSLSLALPTGWTMDALHRLVSFGYGPASALPHVVALAAGALVAAWAGARMFRYQ